MPELTIRCTKVTEGQPGHVVEMFLGDAESPGAASVSLQLRVLLTDMREDGPRLARLQQAALADVLGAVEVEMQRLTSLLARLSC